MRVGLYLADLDRYRTDSHGIINYSLGLAKSLPAQLHNGEEIIIFAGDRIQGELALSGKRAVQVKTVRTPRGHFSRLMMDHTMAGVWAREHELDIFHFPKGHVPLLRPRRTRLVATVHDDIPMMYAHGAFRATRRRQVKALYIACVTRHSLKVADRIITISNFSASSLERHVASVTERLSVIPNGVSLPLSDPRPRACKPCQLFHFGSVYRHKRSREAIAWALEFLGRNPSYRLVVAGRLSPDAESLCAHPSIQRERSQLSNERVAELLRDSVALLFPSVLEGFGLPPVEAMCLGTPAVWARSAAMPEVMADAPGGFRADDRESFLEALDSVVNIGDHDLAVLAERFRARYSWASVARATMELYRAMAQLPG